MRFMVKMLILVLLVMGLAYTSYAQTQIRPAPDNTTIAWDAVEPIDSEVISYKLYIAPYGDYASKTAAGITSELTYKVNIPTDAAMYVVGVSAALNIGEGDEVESDINWSDVNGESTPNPFVYVNLGPPLGLKSVD